MYNTIEDYDENEFEKYEDDLDDEVEAMYFEEEPESEDDYDGEFIGDEGTPDRSVLLSVNDRGATLDDVQSDMKNRMRSFPQEISGPKDIAVIMSQGSNSLSLMPANVQMMQPTLISLDNDSFIEGKIYKKGTVLEIFTEAEQSSFSKDRDSRMDRSILAVSKSLAKDRPISQAQV
jgi:broad specificity phosphatase PhoE